MRARTRPRHAQNLQTQWHHPAPSMPGASGTAHCPTTQVRSNFSSLQCSALPLPRVQHTEKMTCSIAMSYIRIAVIAAAYLLSSRSSSLFRPSCTPPPETCGRMGLDPDTPARAPPSTLALVGLPSSLSFPVAQTTAAGAARPPASSDEELWGGDAALPPAMRGWVRCEGGEGRRHPTFEPRPAPPLVTISFAWPRQAACARQRSALAIEGEEGVFAGPFG